MAPTLLPAAKGIQSLATCSGYSFSNKNVRGAWVCIYKLEADSETVLKGLKKKKSTKKEKGEEKKRQEEGKEERVQREPQGAKCPMKIGVSPSKDVCLC